MLIIGVPRETFPGEARVALVPAVIQKLTNTGLKIIIETNSGLGAGFPDEAYTQKGAQIVDRETVFRDSNVILQVRSLGSNEAAGRNDLGFLQSKQVLIGLMNPLGKPEAMAELASHGVTAFALELIPRIARAQSMDVLSSMATVIGYKAVILAADHLKRLFPLLMTAAGTILPARVFIIGAGVAGLQAISTAKRLGAVVHAYDVRPAAKEQVQSLGAKFAEIPLEAQAAETSGGYARVMDQEFYKRQQEMMKKFVKESDVVITTAAVFGSKAPVLVTADMVRSMDYGSVIVDLVAEQGGNCELTQACETIIRHDVTIIAPDNLASTVPYHASQMYANNITNFLLNLTKNGKADIGQFDLADDIIRETMIIHDGLVTFSNVKK